MIFWLSMLLAIVLSAPLGEAHPVRYMTVLILGCIGLFVCIERMAQNDSLH